MNILSVIVPSYNSESYLSKCIKTLLDSGEGIEILIVNDGSTDRTQELADDYVKAYPDRIKAIHQENAGHGGAVNTGIAHATGRYIKVVDSDDWVNPTALRTMVKKLETFIQSEQKVDMVLSNFVYDKKGEKRKKIMQYRKIMPQNEVFTWKEVGKFRPGKYILMHSVIYSAEVLKKCQLVLPKHTFYVDNLFVFLPLPFVDNMYYMDECIYHYFIGRDDQSVNEENMIRRIDQQLLVNKIMLESIDFNTIKNKKKRKYMLHYLNIITIVSSVLLIKKGTDDALDKKKNLWRSIKSVDRCLYLRMRTSLLGSIINIPGVTGRKITLFVYQIAQRRFGFN